ncbi:MAG TPA: hypothetical protein PKJ08_01225 [Candidatus Cloacimonadota bacterium]|nr:hypothetical protein [Candidatus Cloacimonadota bacterium]
MDVLSHSFNDLIGELALQLNEALKLEEELQSALKAKDSEHIKACQADLLHIYRMFSNKMYHLLEQHLNDLDVLMELVHKLKSQIQSTALNGSSTEKKISENGLDKILSDFSQFYQKTGENSKALWLIKE